MSSIDDPNIIRRLMERSGNEPGRMYKGKKVIDTGHHTTEQIWQYTTGFGGICYKLIYSIMPNGMRAEEAAARFLGTANIKSGTTPVCLFHSGKLTKAGEDWWKKNFGILTMPGNKN